MPNSPPVRTEPSRHAISVLIVTVAVLWNVVALTRAVVLNNPGPLWFDTELGLWMGLAYGQVMLAAGYLSWGRWNIAIRAAVLSVVIITSSVLSSEIVGGLRLYLTIYLRIALAIAVPLAGLRFFGLQLVHADLIPARQRSRQFTLWQLLSLVTAAAILLTLARWNIVADDEGWTAFVTWLVPQSAVGLGCLILPLAVKRWWWAACVTAAASFVLGIWYLNLSDNYMLVTLAMTQWFVVVGCCTVVRLAGYRLTWQSVPAPNQPASSAPPHTTGHPGT